MKRIVPAFGVLLSILLVNISNLPAQAKPDVKWQTIEGV